LRRALVWSGAGALLVGLAFLVARPSVPDPATTPYVGLRGGSRGKAAGLKVTYQRDGVERVVEPGTALRAGDRLRLVVRGERPRHLEVRLRDGDGPVTTVFPAGAGETTPVPPGETLPVTPILVPGGARVVMTALFSDQPRPLGVPPDDNTEVVNLVILKEQGPPAP
jgi:hypothetical protein